MTADDIVRAARGLYNSLPHMPQDDPRLRLIAQTDIRVNNRWESERGAVRGSYVIGAVEAISLALPELEILDESISEALRIVGSPLVSSPS